MTQRLILPLLLLTFASVAVAFERTPSPDGAAVGFANVSDGDIVPLEFTLRFTIEGMGIAPAGVAIENTGHHHLLIDVEELPPLDGPLPASDQVRHFGKGQSETELSLTEGPHTLQLLLGDHMHVPHDPPVLSERITVIAQPGAPMPGTEQEN